MTWCAGATHARFERQTGGGSKSATQHAVHAAVVDVTSTHQQQGCREQHDDDVVMSNPG